MPASAGGRYQFAAGWRGYAFSGLFDKSSSLIEATAIAAVMCTWWRFWFIVGRHLKDEGYTNVQIRGLNVIVRTQDYQVFQLESKLNDIFQ